MGRRASGEVMGEEVDMEVEEVVAMEAMAAVEVMVEVVDMVETMEAMVEEEVVEEWVVPCHSSRWSRS